MRGYCSSFEALLFVLLIKLFGRISVQFRLAKSTQAARVSESWMMYQSSGTVI